MAVTVFCSSAGIPQVVIITKIDDICHEISEDLKNVYKVQYVREKVCLIIDNVNLYERQSHLKFNLYGQYVSSASPSDLFSRP